MSLYAPVLPHFETSLPIGLLPGDKLPHIDNGHFSHRNYRDQPSRVRHVKKLCVDLSRLAKRLVHEHMDKHLQGLPDIEFVKKNFYEFAKASPKPLLRELNYELAKIDSQIE